MRRGINFAAIGLSLSSLSLLSVAQFHNVLRGESAIGVWVWVRYASRVATSNILQSMLIVGLSGVFSCKWQQQRRRSSLCPFLFRLSRGLVLVVVDSQNSKLETQPVAGFYG